MKIFLGGEPPHSGAARRDTQYERLAVRQRTTNSRPRLRCGWPLATMICQNLTSARCQGTPAVTRIIESWPFSGMLPPTKRMRLPSARLY
jgi:hypothetical protein